MTSRFWKTLNATLSTFLNFSTTYHPETDGQIEQVNHVLEDLLHMYYMEQQYKWEEYFPLVEFSYNKSYHYSLGMAPFEALYRQRCQTPISWDRVEDMFIVGLEMLREMEEQVILICSHLNEAAA